MDVIQHASQGGRSGLLIRCAPFCSTLALLVLACAESAVGAPPAVDLSRSGEPAPTLPVLSGTLTDVTVSGHRIRTGIRYQQIVNRLGPPRKITKGHVRTERGFHRVIYCQYLRDWATYTFVITDDQRQVLAGAYVLGGY
jgi:hypothetical protein